MEYAIYFDVTENDGVRTISNVTGLVASGDVTVFHEESSEGWWADIILPMSGSFYILDEVVDLLVNTTSKADYVTIELVMVENVSHSYTIILTHLGDKITPGQLMQQVQMGQALLQQQQNAHSL